jgi:hypothetical protein
MPITGSARLEPGREKKRTRQDKRHEMKKNRAKASGPARPVVSALKKRGH